METSDHDKSPCTDSDGILRPAKVKIQIYYITRFCTRKSLVSSSFYQAILNRAIYTDHLSRVSHKTSFPC